MDKQIDLRIPVDFKKVNEYQIEDTRFIKCKIYLMHTGKNLNGSIFEKNTVEKAIPTLANTPILGFIEDNSNGDEDFSDHREEIEIKNDEIKIKYKGQAIGVIPETNNARFEMRICDDNVEREFLVVDGLLWTKFEDSKDIFKRDKCKKQSMELDKDYTGHFNNEGYFVFDSFSFNGACALGEDVMPAMRSASIDTEFAMNEIQQKLMAFTNYINNQSSNEVDIKEIGKEEVILEDTTNIVVDEVTNNEPSIVEETNAPTVPNEENTVEANTEEIITETTEVVEEVVTETVENVEVQPEFIEKSEYERLQAEFEQYKKDYSTPNTEVTDLRIYKENTIKEKYESNVSNLFEKFDENLSDMESYKNLKSNYSQLSLDEIEEKLFALLGKKSANFSTKATKENVVKVVFDSTTKTEPTDPYGGLLVKHYNN